MTPKSAITLCAAAIIYVFIAAIAVVSPHGDRFSSAAVSSETNEGGNNAPADVSVSDDTQNTAQPEIISSYLLFTDASGVQIKAPQDGMTTFSSTKITITLNGQEKTFTAAHFKSLMDWSGLSFNSDWVVFKGKNGAIYAVRSTDLEKTENAYVIYADENGNPLNPDEYGDFCIYLKEGTRKGFFKNVDTIDFG